MKDYSQIITDIEKSGVSVKRNVRLSAYTTFKIGGPCPVFVECFQPEEVIRTIQILNRHRQSFFLMGGGSNVIVADRGLDCVVVRFYCDQAQIKLDQTEIRVAAATRLDDLAFFCARSGLAGLNFTSGIYGTVGGAVAGNAGAFGQQVADRLKAVRLLTKSGELKEVSPAQLEFSYRDSLLKKTGDIVLEARFLLKTGDPQILLKERNEILELRRQKHPDIHTHPSAGSVFRNLESASKSDRRKAAGWLLEQAGVKSLKVGGAAVFEKHANIIINTGQATAQDVQNLARAMAQSVEEKFKIQLIPEVCVVSDCDGEKFLI